MMLRSVLQMIIIFLFVIFALTESVIITSAQEVNYPVEIVPQVGHSGNAEAVAISPDGALAISASEDKTLILWNVADGKIIRNLKGHSGGVTSVAFSPDGKSALSGGEDSTLRLWNVATGATIREMKGHAAGVDSVAFSPDGKLAVSGGADKIIHLWDTTKGITIREMKGHSNFIQFVAFSPDGRNVLSGGNDQTLRLWDVATGRTIREMNVGSGGARSAAFSPDGKLALSGGYDKILRLWDVATGKLVREMKGHSQGIASVAISPDGRLALTAGEFGDDLRVWNIATGKTVLRMKGVPDGIRSVAFSPDGHELLTSSGGGIGALRRWDLANGTVIREFTGETNQILSIAVSPDGKVAMSGGGDAIVRLWDIESGKIIRELEGHSNVVTSVAFSRDGKLALSGAMNESLRLWDVATGTIAREIKWPFGGSVTYISFLPDGKRVILLGDDSTYYVIIDITKGNIIHKGGFSQYPSIRNFLTLSPDGSKGLSGDASGNIYFKDLVTEKINQQIRGGEPITAAAFSQDGTKLLLGTESGNVKILDAANGRIFRIVHLGQRKILSISSIGTTTIATSAAGDVKRFDIDTGSLIWESHEKDGVISSIVDSRNSQFIFETTPAGIARYLSKKTGELLVTAYTGERDIILLTPEGFFDASPDAAKALTIVRGLEVYSIDQVYDQLYRPDLVREKLAGDPKGLVKAAAAKINLDAAIGSGAPPKISFVNSPTSVGSDSVKLEIDLADQGGGIGKVEWRVNGVTVGVGNRGVARVDGASAPLAAPAAGDASPKSMRLAQEIALAPGENTVEVVAYNAKGLVASVPVAIKITSSQAQAKGPGKLWVLGIGVNDYYDSRLALNYAVPDAQAIVGGFKAAKGTIYDTVETRLVADGDVTVEKLDATFGEIGAKAKPQDTFVLFVAGHGKTVDGRYYYLPRDFRYRDETSFQTSGIGQPQFQAWLARVKAQRSVLLFDTCESGSLTEDRVALRGVERAVAMEKMTAAMGRTTIAAASDDKPALEGYRGHGVFTYAILQGFSAADTNHDGKVDVLELIQYLDRAVPDLSDKAFKFRQIPQAKFSGNNFTLASQTTIVPDEVPASAPSAAQPAKPTHVVIAPTEVMAGAGTGVTAQRLAPGALVTVVRTDQGWVLVAKDGREIGFVSEKALARLQ